MAKAVPLREVSAVKKNERLVIFFLLNKITHYLKKRTTGSGILKKNILYLQKRDASNRSS